MKQPNFETIFKLEDEIRRVDREQLVRRWTHEQLLRGVAQGPIQRRLALIWYRVRYLVRTVIVRLRIWLRRW